MWTDWMQGPILAQLGWVLAHFLWQGALIAGLHAGGVYLLRHHAPDVRYALSLAALLGLMACPIVTWVMLPVPEVLTVAEPVHEAGVPNGIATHADGAARHALGQTYAPPVVMYPGAAPNGAELAATPPSNMWYADWVTGLSPARAEALLRRMVALWLLGVGLLSVRLAGGWGYAQYIRHTATPAEARWQACADRFAAQLGLRRGVRVLSTVRVASPATIGWWRPVVLVPVGLFTGLPPEQAEAILLHELAHIRRHDYLVGLVQAVAETLLFYHPAVWYVSGHLRREREFCCDDVAVTLGASRVAYVRVLASMAERKPSARPVAMAVHGGSLLDRIRRLVHPSPAQARSPHVTLAGGMAVALLVTAMAACASQAPARTTEAEADEARPSEIEGKAKAAVTEGPNRVGRDGRHRVMVYRSERDIDEHHADDSGDSARATVIVNDDTLYFAGEGPDGTSVFRITSDKPIRILNADSLRREGLVPRGQRTFTRGDSTYVRLFTDVQRYHFIGPDSLDPGMPPPPDAPLPPGVSVVIPDLPDLDVIIPDVPLPPDSAFPGMHFHYAPGAPGGNMLFFGPDSNDLDVWAYRFDADSLDRFMDTWRLQADSLYGDSLAVRMEEWARRFAEEQEERAEQYREWVERYGARIERDTERFMRDRRRLDSLRLDRFEQREGRSLERERELLERRAERLRREAEQLEERLRQLEERRRTQEGGDDERENGNDRNENAQPNQPQNQNDNSQPSGEEVRTRAPRAAFVSVHT